MPPCRVGVRCCGRDEGDREVKPTRPPCLSEGKRSYISGGAEGGSLPGFSGGRTDGSFPRRRSQEAELHTPTSVPEVFGRFGSDALPYPVKA